MAGKAEGGCFIEAGSEVVAGGLATGGVAAPAAGAEGYVVVFRNKEVGIVAGVFQLPDDGGGDLPSVAPFVEAAVRGAFAEGVGAVTVVNQYFHVQVV